MSAWISQNRKQVSPSLCLTCINIAVTLNSEDIQFSVFSHAPYTKLLQLHITSTHPAHPGSSCAPPCALTWICVLCNPIRALVLFYTFRALCNRGNCFVMRMRSKICVSSSIAGHVFQKEAVGLHQIKTSTTRLFAANCKHISHWNIRTNTQMQIIWTSIGALCKCWWHFRLQLGNNMVIVYKNVFTG